MLPRHRRTSTKSSMFTRAAGALAIVVAISACAGSGLFPPATDPYLRASIAVENMSGAPVRVYLVQREGGTFLLGRVYPMQSEQLRLPAHIEITDARAVTLVAVPLAGPLPRYGYFGNAAHSAPMTSVREIASRRWVMTSSTLTGALR